MHAKRSEKARISKAERGHDNRQGRPDRHKTELRGYSLSVLLVSIGAP